MADDDFSPTFMRNSTAYGVSPRLRGDLVVNNLIGFAYLTGEVLIKSDGSPWRPLVHIEDISRAFLAVLEAPRELVHNEAFNVGVDERELPGSATWATSSADVVDDATVVYADDARPRHPQLPGQLRQAATTLPAGFRARVDGAQGRRAALRGLPAIGSDPRPVRRPRYCGFATCKGRMQAGRTAVCRDGSTTGRPGPEAGVRSMTIDVPLSCGAPTCASFLDLGDTRSPNALVPPRDSRAPRAPLPARRGVLSGVRPLVQIPRTSAGGLFVDDYLYFSSFSDLAPAQPRSRARSSSHPAIWVRTAWSSSWPATTATCCRTSSKAGIPVLGIDPAPDRPAANEDGVPTLASSSASSWPTPGGEGRGPM